MRRLDNPPVACVDLGTNTCLMTLGVRDGTGVKILLERHALVRLGQGVDATGMLHGDAMDRVLRCLSHYAAVARAAGAAQLELVATSAMRDASNGAEFAETITRQTGFRARVIDGDEEAALTYASAQWDFSGLGRPVAAFDIGGGSTEVILTPTQRHSLKLGSVRLKERFLHHDVPTTAELQEARAFIRAGLSVLPLLAPGSTLVGLAGTVTTLMACTLGLAEYEPAKVHGGLLTLSQVTLLGERLARATAAERLLIKPMEAGREDVIVAGALLVEELMRTLGVETVRVSNGGVRHGLLYRVLVLRPPAG